MYLAVINVEPIEKYNIVLTFENDEIRIFDMNPYLEKGIFKELKDINHFNRVRVSFDTIEWENGIDLDPEFLYQNSIEFVK